MKCAEKVRISAHAARSASSGDSAWERAPRHAQGRHSVRERLTTAAGYGKWKDEQKSACVVTWKKMDEWGNLIYQWVRRPLASRSRARSLVAGPSTLTPCRRLTPTCSARYARCTSCGQARIRPIAVRAGAIAPGCAHGVAAAAEFHGLDGDVVLGALQSLEARRKAAIVPGGTLDETGVKFLEL
jgi:hypothetical protein